jgi:hypothetical protein
LWYWLTIIGATEEGGEFLTDAFKKEFNLVEKVK